MPDPFTSSERNRLLATARASIRHGLDHGVSLSLDLDDQPTTLCEPRACFVTLERDHRLRGCIGSLEAREPLLLAVARMAYQSAFEDPRFAPLRPNEFSSLHLSLSVLSPSAEMAFSSEAELVRQLRPGKDGIILDDCSRRATFLPSVWEQLPRPEAFLAELKRKAGWSRSYWSPTLRAYRYTTESISEPEFAIH